MIAIATYMQRGRLQRELPAFFNFLIFQIATFGVPFPLRNSSIYFYAYWVFKALSILFGFAVLVELVQKVVDGTKPSRHSNIALFCSCALTAMVVIGMWPLPYTVIDNVTNGIFFAERAIPA